MIKYKLEDISLVVGGGTPPTTNERNYDGDIVWITPKDLSDQNEKFIERGQRSITLEGFNACSAQMIPPYNILMSSRAPIGLLAINRYECCTNQGFKSLILNKDICDVDYVYYYLKHHIREIESLGSGTTFKEVSKKALQSFEFSLPELEVQLKISKLLSDIDAKITLNRSINHNLEAMAKQLYDYWFVQFDFPDENGKPYKSSGGKMVWNEKLKREIPEGWEVASLNRELEIKSGYAFKSESYSSEGRFKIVTIKNVQDGYLDISTCECIETLPKDIKKWCILQKGDRLISLTGNCGRVCRVTSEALLLNQRVGVFCSNELFSEYFFQFLASNEGNRYCVNLANGAAQANLSPIDLCKMESIYPSRETLSLFNKIVQPIIQQYIANEQKMENLTKLRDSLLPLLMNGQVSVNYDLSND